MPELPEVEVTRRHLEPVLVGATVARVEVLRERMLRHQPRPRDFCDRLIGRRVHALDRRGKYLLARLAGDFTWVTHLGMTGHLAVADPGTEVSAHTRVITTLRGGPEIRLVDPRTFGFSAVLTPEEESVGSWHRLGPDALDALPSTADLAAGLAGRTAPIKALLLDQGFIAGLGNIYTDEVLFRAGIRPDHPGGSLDRDRVRAVRRSIESVLRDGLRHGGTSLADLAYLLPDGRAGDFLTLLRVYGRTGEPCRRCGTPIERTTLRGRGTHFCPVCQT